MLLGLDVSTPTEKASIAWRAAVEGAPLSLLAADGKLFAVTREGSISCFGPGETIPARHEERAAAPNSPAGAGGGYCLLVGIDSLEAVEQRLGQSPLRWIVLDSDAEKVSRLRKRLDEAGGYGTRASVVVGDLQTVSLPPYLAQQIVVSDSALLESAPVSSLMDPLVRSLRPYGGTTTLELAEDSHQAVAEAVAAERWPGVTIVRDQSTTRLTRAGKLPSSADWTHEYGDPANSLMSQEQLVKAPLGVLWFGGPSSESDLYYDRHEWGPSAAIIEGRMFIQGPQKLTAVDVYTGQILWRRELPDGRAPGRRANWRPAGFHFIAGERELYLTTGLNCLRIDPATGNVLGELHLPQPEDRWGRMMLVKDLLVVSVFCGSDEQNLQPLKLVALDRHTGDVRWTQESAQGFPMIAIGNDKVFCYEGRLEGLFTGDNKIRVNGIPRSAAELAVKALALESGSELWSRKLERIASWLAYSESQDVLLISNKSGIDAWQGSDGEPLWSKQQEGVGFAGHPENYWDRLILWKEHALDQRGPGRRYHLRTGEPVQLTHPITGEDVAWEFTKSGHHCNYAIASEHLMTFRAASAGFCDLSSGSTGRLEGFRSGCRNSLIPANGVLNAPNFATGCSCGYSVFTSLALVHVPTADFWTYGVHHKLGGRVERLGINLGAPGDRHHEDTLWLGASATYGPPITVAPAEAEWFSLPTASLSGEGLPWVAAHGVEGVESITLPLLGDGLAKAGAAARRYTVRLHFVEPTAAAEAGQRVFSVFAGNQTLADLDIVAETGGSGRMLVKELRGVEAAGELSIRFSAQQGKPLLCGVEVIAESADEQDPPSTNGD